MLGDFEEARRYEEGTTQVLIDKVIPPALFSGFLPTCQCVVADLRLHQFTRLTIRATRQPYDHPDLLSRLKLLCMNHANDNTDLAPILEKFGFGAGYIRGLRRIPPSHTGTCIALLLRCYSQLAYRYLIFYSSYSVTFLLSFPKTSCDILTIKCSRSLIISRPKCC